MIPPNVRKTHLDQAIRRVRRDGVPPRRRGRAYELVVDGASLPPKYVLAVAIELATGTHPSSDSFGGGAETNDFLRSHGFTVVHKGAAIPKASTRLRVARAFLDLGVRQRAYRAVPAHSQHTLGGQFIPACEPRSQSAPPVVHGTVATRGGGASRSETHAPVGSDLLGIG